MIGEVTKITLSIDLGHIAPFYFEARQGEKMSSSDDDEPFVKILKAMGIDNFDPLVPVALNEYAARKLSNAEGASQQRRHVIQMVSFHHRLCGRVAARCKRLFISCW